MLRLVFMGTPEFSVPCLQHLLQCDGMQVVGVVTQPDKPAKRGQQLTPPPVKQLAQQHGLTVWQPKRLRKDEACMAWLETLQPDALITIAFGQILPLRVLQAPRLGTVNVHASLLPAYRGPNPIQWALLNGDTETWLTTMLTDEGVDTGDMLQMERLPILPQDNLGTLSQKLATLAGPLLETTLRQLAASTLTPTPQPHHQATHAPKLEKAAFTVNWNQPAQAIVNHIRALAPQPGALACLGDLRLKILEAEMGSAPLPSVASEQKLNTIENGQILAIMKEGLAVKVGESEVVCIRTLQPPGKKPMPASDWARNALRTLPNPQDHRFAPPALQEVVPI